MAWTPTSGGVTLAALAAGAVGVPAGAVAPAHGASPPRPAPLFEWTMPARYGESRDARGHIVETKARQVRRGPWRVRLQVTATSCRDGGVYRWSVNGKRLRTRGSPGCAFEARLPVEGAYPIRLDARLGSRRFTQTQQVTVEDWLIVSIGDSVASGEAVPDAPDLFDAAWQSARCHRSARAAPARAAERIEAEDDHTSVTFLHLACSGATMHEGLLGSYGGVLKRPFSRPLEPQIDVLGRVARRRRVDAVLVSVGANDVYFGDIVRFCGLRPAPNCFVRPLPAAGGRTIDDAVGAALRRLPGDYAALARRIGLRVPARRVHLVDYFDPTRDARGVTCRTIFGFIGRNEVELAQSRVVGPLNRVIAERAREHGWNAVTGMADRFRTHGYCAGRQSWVTTLSRSVARLGGQAQGRFLGTLHPNEAGQDAIADEITRSLERRLYPGQSFAPAAQAGARPERGDTGLPAVALVAIGAGGALLAVALVWLVGRLRGGTAAR